MIYLGRTFRHHFTNFLLQVRVYVRRVVPKGHRHRIGSAGRRLITLLGSEVPDGEVGVARLAQQEATSCGTLRVVFVNSGLGAGGAERQILNTVRGLVTKSSVRVYFLGLNLHESKDVQALVPDMLRLGVDPSTPMSLVDAKHELDEAFGTGAVRRLEKSLLWAPPDFASEVVRVAAEFRRLQPTVIHGWQDAPGLVAAFAGLALGIERIVLATRSVSPVNFSHFRPHFKPAYRFLVRQMNVLLTNNSVAGISDYSSWLGVPSRRFLLIKNGIDILPLPDPAACATMRKSLAIPPTAKILGGVFRFEKEKRPLLWLHAAEIVLRALPDTFLVVQGLGSMETLFRSEARKKGLENRLRIVEPSRNAGRTISCFDVLLLTSEVEGTPNVVLEAASMGIPAVVTAGGGAEEAVDNGVTGLVVPIKQDAVTIEHYAKQIAEEIVRILCDSDFSEQVRVAGPKFVEAEYGLHRMIDKTINLYTDG